MGTKASRLYLFGTCRESSHLWAETGNKRAERARAPLANQKGVDCLMRSAGLRATAMKSKATTDSAHKLPIAENVLARESTATAPNQKWMSDTTYIWTTKGWLYLALVIELYSRSVVGWALSARMTAELVSRALQMAVSQSGKVAKPYATLTAEATTQVSCSKHS